MMMRLYVVEIHTGRRWEPTVGARLTRKDAREELREWKGNNPCDRFRVAIYRAVRAIKP